MRTWRVGTFSMGASLLFLGLYLFLAQLLGLNVGQVMLAWWPIILVVLGIEILVYLFFSGKEKPFLKYDLLSIFLVGVLGTVGIGFAILNSTGLVGKIADVLDRKEQSFVLPEFSKSLSNDVKRIVVDTGIDPVTIEGTAGKEVAMFGTYRAAVSGKEKLVDTADDYVSFHQKGDTLYVSFKGLPEEIGPFDNSGTISATIVIPHDVKLEVIGHDNPITMKPRMLLSDWTVDRASSVALYVEETSDVLVSAIGAQDLQGQESTWKVSEGSKQQVEEMVQPDEGTPSKIGTFQMGDGTHQLKVLNAYSVSLNTIK